MLALAIVLLIVGLVFVVGEVFFVSMGALSLLAFMSILAATILAFQHSQTTGWIFIGAEIVLVPLMIWTAFRLLPHVPFGRRMLLQGPATGPAGGFPSLDHLAGQTGEALTDLRPAGTARIGDERVSVVALGQLIPRGTEVKVVSVQGPEVKVNSVRPLSSEDDA